MTSNRVRLVEVGPRDGLQNESHFIATDTKLELIERLVRAGVRAIEATSFVSPHAVPQMADHQQILQRVKHRAGVSYSVLVPNLKGFEAAAAAGATEVAVFAAASESFSQRNINCSIGQSLARFAPVIEAAQREGIHVRGYVSCVVGCPYEGAIAPLQVAGVAERLVDMGCREVSLGDTIGIGTPPSLLRMLEAVARRVPVPQLAGHYHDTYGMAIANVHASYDFGLRTFDTSVAGLGGCPYALGATGNVATEDVAYLLQGLGVETGIDLDALVDAAAWISKVLQRLPASRVSRAVIARRHLAARPKTARPLAVH